MNVAPVVSLVTHKMELSLLMTSRSISYTSRVNFFGYKLTEGKAFHSQRPN